MILFVSYISYLACLSYIVFDYKKCFLPIQPETERDYLNFSLPQFLFFKSKLYLYPNSRSKILMQGRPPGTHHLYIFQLPLISVMLSVADDMREAAWRSDRCFLFFPNSITNIFPRSLYPFTRYNACLAISLSKRERKKYQFTQGLIIQFYSKSSLFCFALELNTGYKVIQLFNFILFSIFSNLYNSARLN